MSFFLFHFWRFGFGRFGAPRGHILSVRGSGKHDGEWTRVLPGVYWFTPVDPRDQAIRDLRKKIRALEALLEGTFRVLPYKKARELVAAASEILGDDVEKQL